VEGDARVPDAVQALRVRQAKNFFTLLLLANGTPMFRAGDEFLQTQRGNNNPYNQDNEITWLDWDRLVTYADVHRFVRGLIAFRKATPTLVRNRFWHDDVRWYGVDAQPDLSWDSHSLAMCIHGGSVGGADVYVMVNAYWEPLTFHVQEGPPEAWHRIVDTARESPDDFVEPETAATLSSDDYVVGPRSVVVLVRR
jgi:glycogen operon protein